MFRPGKYPDIISEYSFSELRDLQEKGPNFINDFEILMSEMRSDPPSNRTPEENILLIEKLTEIISIIRDSLQNIDEEPPRRMMH